MAKLFLDGAFMNATNSPSAVRVTFMTAEDKIESIVGLMTGDVTFSAQNKWGPVINDISNLTDLSALVGSQDMFSWISASTMCWKGTEPLSISIEFYLINYKRGLNLEQKLKEFVKLASIAQAGDANAKVRVHGGYSSDVFSSNQDVFKGFFSGKIDSISKLSEQAGNLNTFTNDIDRDGHTVILKFGAKSTITKLLLARVNVTESVIEVADKDGGNKKPLYYKVSAQFTGVKPLITTDVDGIFNF